MSTQDSATTSSPTAEPQPTRATGQRLSGRKALVTGSSTGIGRGIALRFAREGADVAIDYYGGNRDAEEVLAQVRALGRRGVAIQANVADVRDVRDLVTRSADALGGLDILVNNAGIEKRAPFWEVTEEDYEAVLGVNLKGVFFGTQAFVRHCMDAKRGGKVIHISSVHEDMAFPHFAAYCASKGGVRMLTRTLAVELAPLGITVNGIAPGAIETPINSALLHDPAKLTPLLEHIPAGRLGTPDDVAGLAVFLASADADYVTGATYVIDGGLMVSYKEQ